MRALPALGAFVIALASATSARAEPQWNTGIAVGVAGTGENFGWDATKFYGALRGELLFGRRGRTGPAIGPALELGTVKFDDLRASAGATLLLPFDDLLALGLTPAACVHVAHGDTSPCVAGRVFFGLHPHNRVGSYALAGGLIAGVDRDVGSSKESAYVIAAQLDGIVLALPVILLVEWLRGPRR